MYVLLVIYLFTDGEFRTQYETYKTLAACEMKMAKVSGYTEKNAEVFMYGASCTEMKGRES